MLDPTGHVGEVPVLLTGDAAGLTNPVTGAGINAAVLSGAMAGKAAAAFLSGRANALADFAEELEDLFGASLRRALSRRQTLLQHYAHGKTPRPEDLRAAWIAYPDYWAA
jgi:flavin-dependent dehydrogenase